MPRNDNHELDIQPQHEHDAHTDCTHPVNSQIVTNSHDSENSDPTTEPFSVYTKGQKWIIISLAAFAALFSPLTVNIYFPAIQTLSNAFHTSIELINVTVTVYMILQGIAPMFWGTLADRVGRRPLFLACLALLAISCVGLALVPTNAYWLLVLLRCFQAAGSSSTMALGFGTVSDIAEPSERGGFIGVCGLALLLGPCIGPIIGGLLTAELGWRSIFWFLVITSGAYLMVLFLIFPETLRVLVGNGAVAPARWNRPVLPFLTKYTSTSATDLPPPKKFINPLLQFTHPSAVLVLLFNGTVFSVLYGVLVSLSKLFADAYPFLTESDIGVCFLAIGVGCGLGSVLNGKILDANFRRIQRELDKKGETAMAVDLEKGIAAQKLKVAGKLDDSFPIEYARLRLVPAYVAVIVVCVAGYGWVLQRRVHIACPLILQFLIGSAIICVVNTSQTLLLDLFPTQGSSISAATNLVRCLMGAGLVSIIDFILSALRPGWTYTLLALLCVLMLPTNWIVIKFGPRWRASRIQEA